jgi:hypothetical protein
MRTYIDMFNVDNYYTWEIAELQGAVHTVEIYSVDNPNEFPSELIMSDVGDAIDVAIKMIAGNARYETRTRSE